MSALLIFQPIEGPLSSRVHFGTRKCISSIHTGPSVTQGKTVRRHREWVTLQPHLMAALPELRGRDLVSWCAPAQCHGDVLKELVNAGSGEPMTALTAPDRAKLPKLFAMLASDQGALRAWERWFVSDLPRFTRISSKQRYIVAEIADRMLGVRQ